MKTRETNEQFAERIRNLPRLERKRLIEERMSARDEAELLRDLVLCFVALTFLALAPFIF